MCEAVCGRYGVCRDADIWRSGVMLLIVSIFAISMGVMYGLVLGLWAVPELGVTKFKGANCFVTGKEPQTKLCNHTLCYRALVFVNLEAKSFNLSTACFNTVTGSYSTTFNPYRWLARFVVGHTYPCFYDPKDPATCVFYNKMPIGPLLAAIFLGLLPLTACCLCSRIAIAWLCQDRYGDCRLPCCCLAGCCARSESRTPLLAPSSASSTTTTATTTPSSHIGFISGPMGGIQGNPEDNVANYNAYTAAYNSNNGGSSNPSAPPPTFAPSAPSAPSAPAFTTPPNLEFLFDDSPPPPSPPPPTTTTNTTATTTTTDLPPSDESPSAPPSYDYVASHSNEFKI